LKPLHKQIMTSTAYRQSSLRSERLDRLDPENRLLGRMNVRRLEAETVRDAVLAVCGTLNKEMFGPPLSVAPDGVGQVVIGTKAGSRDGRVVPPKGDAAYRRSVYVQVRRSLPLAMLEAFDAPAMMPNCELRTASTVTPQALLLMNNDFIVEQSERFAEGIVREVGDDPERRVDRAWRQALGTSPTEAQRLRAVQFLAEQKEHFAARPRSDAGARFTKDPGAQALASFCQFLMSTNAFLYVD